MSERPAVACSDLLGLGCTICREAAMYALRCIEKLVRFAPADERRQESPTAARTSKGF